MELLLFLTALLTGFTGALSGARAAERSAVEQAAVQAVSRVAASAEAVSPRASIPAASVGTLTAQLAAPLVRIVATSRSIFSISESWLE